MKLTLRTCTIFVTAALTQQAYASGYHFGTQSVTAQSTANAAAAEAADATTIFTNPAGLTKLDSSQITIATNIVAPSIKYYDAKSTYRRTGQAVAGENSGKITKDIEVVPHLYGAYKASDKVTLGLGVYVPFGSSTDYSKNSVLRYNLNHLGLTSVDIEPVVAYKFNEKHSFAAGVIAQYSQAEVTKYADWDVSGAMSAVASAIASKRAGRAVSVDATGKADGHSDMSGHDWGFGYQLGWMWDINDRTRVGVNYRSKINHTLKGSADWYADGPYAQAGYSVLSSYGYVPHEKASVKIVTPESLSVHGMYKATDKLNLFGDITWTRHSRFNTAELVFEHEKVVGANKQSDRTIIKPNWRNTYKVAVGGSYQYSEPLQLRAGIAFDQTPVRGAESRLNTLPDGNRIWLSAGMRYAYQKHHVFDVAYSHIHINDTSVSTAASLGNDVDSKGVSSAKFRNHADILGLQYTYKF